MHNIDIPVIVIGGNHHNTLGVIRSLGRNNIYPFVILTSASTNSFVLKSKYIKKSYVVNNSESAIDLLISTFVTEEVKPVVIACHDVISSQIDLNRQRLDPYFVLPGCKESGRVTYYMDKSKMGKLAEECGLCVPQTILLSRSSYRIEQEINFPCITKPVQSRIGSKSDIHICYNRDDLLSIIGPNELLIQHYVEKQFEFQLIGCSLEDGKHVIIPGVSVILRQPATTNTGFLHYKPLDDSFTETVKKTEEYIKNIGYSGLFSVEYLRDINGIDYFMEINFRNDGNAISVTNAGVNLPYLWYRYAIGERFKEESHFIHDEFVMPEFAELSLLEQGQITFHQWRLDMRKSTSYMDYASDDPLPTRGWKNYCIRFARVVIKLVLKKLLRYEAN